MGRPLRTKQAKQADRTSQSNQAHRAALSTNLDENLELLRQALGKSDDIQYQPFTLRWDGRRCLVAYIDGLCNTDSLQHHVLEPLLSRDPGGPLPDSLQALGRQFISVAEQKVVRGLDRVRDEVYRGKAVVLVDGYPGALVAATQGWEERPVQSPPTESVLRGPRDGFIENITTNIALVRRRICDRTLRVRYFRVGVRSKTRVAMLYLEDIARPQLVHEMATRIAAVEFDAIQDTNQLREMLAPTPWYNPFPKMESTERPDKVAAALLSGKVAVMVDNSPFASVAPATLIDFLWAPDDYYSSPTITLLIRTVRVLGWMAAVFFSPLYIAVQMYNPDLVRFDMALYLAEERHGLPLTAALEIYFLELMMEMVHEATVRLPSKIGSAATVVGGLIIGQAAAQARIVSTVVIIVAAISAIGSFTLPGQEVAQVWRATKWGLILFASLFGVYGTFAAAFCLLAWLASQDSFGTPYLAPLAPFIPKDLKRDSIFRRPWAQMVGRPATYRPRDRDRTGVEQGRKYKDGGER